jgi:hypothetical protein
MEKNIEFLRLMQLEAGMQKQFSPAFAGFRGAYSPYNGSLALGQFE